MIRAITPTAKNPGNFAHGVQPTDVGAIEIGNLDNKIVQQRRPDRKGQSASQLPSDTSSVLGCRHFGRNDPPDRLG
jgi:hypothetical protein